MKLAYEWLNEFIDLNDIAPRDLAEKMSRTGIEVDSVEQLDQKLSKLIVGQIKDIREHENSDHLKVTLVDCGEPELRQIVCGDPKITVQQKVIVALPGAELPGGIIKKGKLRGKLSDGMLCSLEELGFSDSVIPSEAVDRVTVLPEETEIGTDVLDLYKCHQALIELDITPNRADALSMRGAVHEISAIYGRPNNLKPDTDEIGYGSEIPGLISVGKETNDVFDYNMLIIKNVTIGPSPIWMQARLMHAGIRPINNVVDITNYVLLEYGQPLHAFDYDKLKAKEVIIRYATDGEELITLDGKRRKLSAHDLVITAHGEPVALAGVMGGESTEIDGSTTTVALESAVFDPTTVRKTSQKFNLRSESSMRFEKGINQATILEAGRYAASLIALLGRGEVVDDVATVTTLNTDLITVPVSLDYLSQKIGVSFTTDQIEKIWKQLEFDYVVNGSSYEVIIPKRRWDISIPADLVEEVARIYGYDNLPLTLPTISGTGGHLTTAQLALRKISRLAEASGISEIISYALTNKETAKRFSLSEEPAVTLAMPMTEDRSTLRQSVVTTMIETVQYNLNRQQRDLALFEIGRVFTATPDQEGLATERMHLGITLTGHKQATKWLNNDAEYTFFDAKGIVGSIFKAFGVEDDVVYEQTSGIAECHPGQTAIIRYNDQVIGFIGKLHPKYAAAHDLADTYVAELDLANLLTVTETLTGKIDIPKFPTVNRDISLQLPENVSYSELISAIKSAASSRLKQVELFDLYEGKQLTTGYKALSFSLVFRDDKQTLTDVEVDEEFNKISAAVTAIPNVTVR